MIKVNKILFIITILMILFTIIIPKQVMARPTTVIDNYGGSSGHSAVFDISGLGNLDDYNGEGGISAEFDTIVNKVINILQVIGSIISVVVLIVIGLKYMFASLEEKASYKEVAIPYIIGAFMVFGISNITGILYNLAKNIF